MDSFGTEAQKIYINFKTNLFTMLAFSIWSFCLRFMALPPDRSASLWDRARSYVYDRAIVSFTSKWYEAILHRLPEDTYLLDVGIGTGAALVANSSILIAKNITVVGVDYDASYIQQCRNTVSNANLADRITVVQADIREFTPPDDRLFNHVYFSGSFMIMPDQVTILKKVVDLLVDREDGRILFTQTFQLQKNALLEWIKPKLANLTSIDFGNVSYEGDFDEVLHSADLCIEAMEVIDDGKKVDGVRESRLVSTRSKIYITSDKESVI